MVEVRVFKNGSARKKDKEIAVFNIEVVPEEIPERFEGAERKARQEKAELECKRAAINIVRELCEEVAESGSPILVARIIEEEESEEHK